ncbi:MAG: aminopeptidase, partial [Spirochaetia bacterium]|nr:aminopeptidase [Spirochaetia bacterium]
RAKTLNALNLRSLHLKSAITDVSIGLSEYHSFEGGGETTTKGHPFYPNIPTEEVFTTPIKDSVNGLITTTKPVSLLDSLVENVRLVFNNGKVVEARAEVGNDVLQQYLEIDEGARYIGEIALVDQRSPISQANTIFHSILYDENASCHFALGAGYPTCLNLPQGLSLEEAGCNQSLVHTDFMFGSDDMSVIGIDRENKEHVIMKEGKFTPSFDFE